MTDAGREPRSERFTSQRLSLHAAAWGEADGRPLILLHGGRDHGRSWDPFVPALLPGRHVVAPDLRGHGDSDWARGGGYGLSHLVYDVDQLLAHFGFAQVDIVAHSLGAMIALRFAALRPTRVARLIAIEGLQFRSMLPPGTTALERVRRWMDVESERSRSPPRDFASAEEAVLRMQRHDPHLSAEDGLRLAQHGLKRSETGTYRWKFDPAVRFRSYPDLLGDFDGVAEAIACPVLLIHGRQSWAADPSTSGVLDRLADARLMMFDDAGHWAHRDRPDLFVPAARAFLAAAPA